MSRNPLQIETGSNGHMMQMRLVLPLVGRPWQSRRAHRLRDRPSDARTPRILLHKGRSALQGATLDEGRMPLWWGGGERAAPWPAGTLGADGTRAAGRRRKADDHRRVLPPI